MLKKTPLFTPVPIFQCSYCSKEITKEFSIIRYSKITKKSALYCDQWCKEQVYPPRIVKCLGCGIAVLPKNNRDSGKFYTKYCEKECCSHLKTRWKSLSGISKISKNTTNNYKPNFLK